MHFLRNLIILLILFLAVEVNAYRILGIFPIAFRSHNIFFQALMKVLAKSGHQVDVISHYEFPKPVDNLTTIVNLSEVDFPFPPNVFENLDDCLLIFEDAIKILSVDYGTNLCKLMDYPKIKDIIMNPPNDPPYDAVIVEVLYIKKKLSESKFKKNMFSGLGTELFLRYWISLEYTNNNCYA